MATLEDLSEVWYDANCHCAAIKLKVKLPPLQSQEIISCNCSICCKNGYLNVRPNKKDIVFVQGEDVIKDYQFGKKQHNHKFCPLCGSSILIEPLDEDQEWMTINVRSSFVLH